MNQPAPEYDGTANDRPTHVLNDLRPTYFYRVDVAVIDHYARVIGPTAFVVYSAIARHAGWESACAWPGRELLAEETGQSVRTVQRAINTLADRDGILTGAGLAPLIRIRQIKPQKGGWARNEYDLLPVGPSDTSVTLSEGVSDTSGTHVSDTHVTHCVTPVAHERESFNESQFKERAPKNDADASTAPANDDPESVSGGDRVLENGGDGEIGGADAPKGIGDTDVSEFASAKAYRNALMATFIRAAGYPKHVANANRGKWGADIKRIFPDEDWTGEPPIAVTEFEAATRWQVAKAGNAWTPSPRTVVQDIDKWRAEHARIDRSLIGAVIAPYKDDGSVAVPNVADVERALRRLDLSSLPAIDLYNAILWKWRRAHQPPKVDHLFYIVKDWTDAGRPEPR